MTEYATTSTTPPTATPIPSSTTVWRLSGATKSAPATSARESTSRQHREQLNALGDVGERRTEAADVPLDELHALGRLELPCELRTHLLQRRGKHRADVGNRERDGVPVTFEERAVDVAHRLAEQARERAASHDLGGHRLDDRARRDEIGLVLQDDLVGELLRDQGANAVVAKRRGGSVGELVRVHGGLPGVCRHQREHDRQRGQNHKHPRRELTRVHAPKLPRTG